MRANGLRFTTGLQETEGLMDFRSVIRRTLMLLFAFLLGAPVLAAEPEYFMLRPEVEKAYGYTHAVRIGHEVKVSGAVSMDSQGNPTALGDMAEQMKNVYGDLEVILAHYGLTFEHVVVENVFTTDMAKFVEVSGEFRAELYESEFPTGSWLEVKGLALPEFLIEIELEAYAPTPTGNVVPH
ncbi:RidA family protein [Congregibacter brevis]|uniref:RidA family protein n=1 Tax=Congregibacter brevis TaxID=3081201 RepID=A0ABZ0ID83_9GAMM|nr:RidA family protein [Congregibacter sp. IMCC45268]